MTATTALALGSRRWLRAFWLTMRPYLLFVSGAAGLVGEALVPESSLVARLAVFVPLFLAYGLGQALTDTFQLDTDSVSAPYRPLVRGEISVAAVRWVSLLGLLGASLVLCAFSMWSLVPAALAVTGLLIYTPCKRRHWAGPACNSLVVALLPVIGGVALAESPIQVLYDPRLGALALSCFGTYAVFVILGYLKDVEADRVTGYDTLPVRYGFQHAVLHSMVYAVVGATASAAVVAIQLSRVPPTLAMVAGLVLWGLGVGGLLWCHRLAWQVARDEQAYPAVGWSVRAFLWLHLGEATVLAQALLPFACALVVAFEYTLANRPARSQI